MEEFVQDALRTEPSKEQYLAAHARLGPLRVMRLLHSSMGLVTEAGEIMDHLKKHIFYGKPLDDVMKAKIISDFGDSSWYYRVGVHALEITMAESIERNVRELKARFPEKFTEHNALNRDEDAEMEAARDGK